MGGMWVLDSQSDDGSPFGFSADACLAISEDSVSIWTTCLNEEVFAWTNVVGYGLVESDLVMGTFERLRLVLVGQWRWRRCRRVLQSRH
jgi:hypothetical protein